MSANAKPQGKDAAATGRRRCPICGKPARAETRPFCSQRCADRDLARWLGGAYRIPTEERPADGPSGDGPGDDDADDALRRRH